jgi:hypothetical protein
MDHPGGVRTCGGAAGTLPASGADQREETTVAELIVTGEQIAGPAS